MYYPRALAALTTTERTEVGLRFKKRRLLDQMGGQKERRAPLSCNKFCNTSFVVCLNC